jgi:GxxExxY protein
VDHDQDPVTREIIAGAIEVHRALGPGLLESIYEECLAVELSDRGLAVQRQLAVPVVFKGRTLDCAYRVDLLVDESVVLEVKAVDRIIGVHEAQLLTFMKLMRKRVGLILNFHSEVMREGIKRRVL